MRITPLALLTAACAVLLAAACRPASPDTALARTESAVPAATAEDSVLQSAPSAEATVQAQSPLVGTWELATPGRLPGMRLTLAVDSVAGGRVYGRLVHYLAGDVGVDPSRYSPLVGDAAGDSVRLPIRARDGSTGFLFEGVLRGDTMFLHSFAIGPDTARGEDVAEVLVRRR